MYSIQKTLLFWRSNPRQKKIKENSFKSGSNILKFSFLIEIIFYWTDFCNLTENYIWKSRNITQDVFKVCIRLIQSLLNDPTYFSKNSTYDLDIKRASSFTSQYKSSKVNCVHNMRRAKTHFATLPLVDGKLLLSTFYISFNVFKLLCCFSRRLANTVTHTLSIS